MQCDHEVDNNTVVQAFYGSANPLQLQTLGSPLILKLQKGINSVQHRLLPWRELLLSKPEQFLRLGEVYNPSSDCLGGILGVDCATLQLRTNLEEVFDSFSPVEPLPTNQNALAAAGRAGGESLHVRARDVPHISISWQARVSSSGAEKAVDVSISAERAAVGFWGTEARGEWPVQKGWVHCSRDGLSINARRRRNSWWLTGRDVDIRVLIGELPDFALGGGLCRRIDESGIARAIEGLLHSRRVPVLVGERAEVAEIFGVQGGQDGAGQHELAHARGVSLSNNIDCPIDGSLMVRADFSTSIP